MEEVRRHTAVIILAAGLGTRMKSDRAKVLHEVRHRPMILYVVETAVSVAAPDHVVVVVGHQAEAVIDVVGARYPVRYARQAEQRGTGHAVQCAMDAVPADARQVIILCGDVPRLKASTVTKLVARHRQDGDAVTVLAVEVDRPRGYGRILRGPNGQVTGIVEEADATETQRAIRLVNSGIYCVERPFLAEALDQIRPDNAQAEFYLTDIVAIARAGKRRVGVMIGTDADEVAGINTVEQLNTVSAAMAADIGKTA